MCAHTQVQIGIFFIFFFTATLEKLSALERVDSDAICHVTSINSVASLTIISEYNCIESHSDVSILYIKKKKSKQGPK